MEEIITTEAPLEFRLIAKAGGRLPYIPMAECAICGSPFVYVRGRNLCSVHWMQVPSYVDIEAIDIDIEDFE